MLRFVSLFSGAGGFDLGLEWAGWNCEFVSDIDSAAIETLQANQGKRTGGIAALAHARIAQADIRELTGRRVLSITGGRKGQIDLLAGGPPCQTFSSAGHQRGFDDPRGRLFEDYVRIAGELDPRWLLFENVRGLLTARGADGVPGSALHHIRTALARAGWVTKAELLNAADYGAAQRRVRLVMIGYRAGDEPPFPAPTHADGESIFQKPWLTLGQCIAGLRALEKSEIIRPSESLARELAHIRPGSGIKSPGKSEATRPGGHWGYKQGAFIADLNRPARTVTAGGQQDWVVDPCFGLRRLSPRECAAIQSFPACWKFAGARSDQYRLIGNAVPPKLARQLGHALADYARGSSKQSTNSSAGANVIPLPRTLEAAIAYTIREEARNGASRRAAQPKRRSQLGRARRAG